MFAFGCNSTLIRQHPTITTTPIQTKLPSTDVAHRNNGQKGRRNHEDPFFTTPRQHFALRRPFKMESVVSICVTAARGRSDKSSIWLLEENLTLSYFCSIWIAYHDDRERMAAIPLFSRLSIFFSPVYDVFSEPTLSASKENIDDAVFVSPVTKSMNAKTRMQMEFAVLEFAVTPKRSNRYCLRRLI